MKVSLFFLNFFLIFHCFGQDFLLRNNWQKTIGSYGDENDIKMVRYDAHSTIIYTYSCCSGDGYLELSNGDKVLTEYEAEFGFDGWLLKVDNQGNIIWQRTIGTADHYAERVSALNVDKDGNIILGISTDAYEEVSFGGIKSEDSKGVSDYWILKLDGDGNVLKEKSFGGSKEDFITDIIVCDNSDYIIVGYSDSPKSGDITDGPLPYAYYYTPWIVRVNSNFEIVWQNYLYYDKIQDILGITVNGKELDNGDIVFGTSNYSLVRLNKSGELLNYRTFTGGISGVGKEDFMTSFDITNNGGFILSGHSSTVKGLDKSHDVIGETDLWVLRIDADFNKIWDNVYGGTGYENRFANSQYGNYHNKIGSFGDKFILATSSESNVSGNKSEDSKGESDLWVVVLDSGGNILWQKTLGGNKIERMNALSIHNNEILIAVSSSSGVSGDKLDTIRYNTQDYVFPRFDIWLLGFNILQESNTVKGRVYQDVNNNNIPDSEDIYIDDIKVQSLIGSTSKIHNTRASGSYSFVVDTGKYFLKPMSAFAHFATVPPLDSVHFRDLGNTDTINFKLSPTAFVNDASVLLINNFISRPARSNSYTISYVNESGKSYNGTIKLKLDSRIRFEDAFPAPTTVSGDTLIWQISNFPLFTKREITVNFTPVNTLVSNDTLKSFVKIYNNTADVTPDNNEYTLYDIVRASYDPNEKVVDKTILSRTEVEETPYIYYTVHFQNIGNDTAFNIYIYDTLDNNLNWNSIDLVASSHEYVYTQTNGKFLQFDFKDILLPDSNVNEKDSHGFITYKIKPKNGLTVGDVILNKASIVFDVNAPIITNTTTTAVMQTKVGESQTICQGESVTLTASGASTYQWNNGVNSAEFTVKPNTTTTYYVTGDVGGVKQRDSVTIFVNPLKDTVLVQNLTSGEVYNFNGTLLSESGIYRDTLEQGNGCDSIIVLNLTVVTSLKNNIEFVNSVKIFPNPVDDRINIELKAEKQASFNISIVNVEGKVLLERNYKNTATIQDNIDISGISSGIYYLKISSGENHTAYSILMR